MPRTKGLRYWNILVFCDVYWDMKAFVKHEWLQNDWGDLVGNYILSNYQSRPCCVKQINQE